VVADAERVRWEEVRGELRTSSSSVDR